MNKSIPFEYSVYQLNLDGEGGSLKPLSLALVHGKLEDLEKECFLFLHQKEIKELEKLTYKERRHSFLLGRYASKKALGSYFSMECRPSHFQVFNGFMGQPYFCDVDCHLSISHSGNYGVAVVGERGIPFSVDIEALQHNQSIPSDVFELQEFTLGFPINWTKEDQKLALWSAKESLVKSLQVGFTVDMNILTISEIIQLRDGLISAKYKYFHALTSWILKTEACFLALGVPSKFPLNIQSFENCLDEGLKF